MYLESDVPLSLDDLQLHCTLLLGALHLGNHELHVVSILHLLLLGVVVERDHSQLATLASVVDVTTHFRPAAKWREVEEMRGGGGGGVWSSGERWKRWGGGCVAKCNEGGGMRRKMVWGRGVWPSVTREEG